MGICKPLGSLNSFLSYVLQVSGTTSCFLIVTSLIPCSPWGMAEDSCFLHSSELLCNHCRGGSICWVTGIVFPFGSPHSHLEAPNHWWLWHFLPTDMARNIPFRKGFPCGSAGKESTCNVGDLGSIPGLGRSLGEGNGYPLQYSGLENSMNCIVHGVTKSQTQLSDFHFTSFHYISQ